ncbi:MAG: hypothetical protein KKG59_00330 [Nanoarchaeota archaeon]|nr:hypothetical protein [Nanoarchaeota archaeon]
MRKHYQTKLKNYLSTDRVNLTASEFIENIDLNRLLAGIIIPPKYEHCKTESIDYIKVIVYKAIKGYSGYLAALRHLNKHPEETAKLNIRSLPAYYSLMEFKNYRLGKTVLKEILLRIENIQSGNGIFIRDNISEHMTINHKNPMNHIPTGFKRKLISEMHQFIMQLRDNGSLYHNVKYTDKDIMRAIMFMNTNKMTANGFSEANRFYYDPYQRGDAPCGKTILEWIKKIFPTREKVEQFNQHILSKIFRYIKKKMPHLTARNKFTIAIDHHLIPVWEDIKKSQRKLNGEHHSKRTLTNPTHIISCAQHKFKSTINFRKYISCSIVINGMRFCTGFKAIDQTNNIFNARLVSDLIDYVKQYVGINTLLLDRNFDNSSMHSMLQRRGIKYIMPKIINGKELRQYREQAENLDDVGDALMTNYTMQKNKRNVTMNLVFVKKQNKNYMKHDYKGKDRNKRFIAYGFATNMRVKSKEAAREIEKIYRSRWGVEVFYKDSKNFFAKTTSNNSVVRDFYFSQSINIFNLWVLCNLILFVMYIKKYPDTPKIRMKTFAISLSEIQYKKRPPP